MRRNTGPRHLGFERLESRSMLAASGFGVLTGAGFAYDSSDAAVGLAPGSGGYSYALGYGGVAGGGAGNDGSGGGGFGSGNFDSYSFGGLHVGGVTYGFGQPVGLSGLGPRTFGPSVNSAGGNLGVGFDVAIGSTIEFAAVNGSNSKFPSLVGNFSEHSGLVPARRRMEIESGEAEATTGVGQMVITTGANTLGISSFATSTNGFSDISGGGGMVVPGHADGKKPEEGKANEGGDGAAVGGELGGATP